MKNMISQPRRTLAFALLIAGTLVLGTGCLMKTVVWSPDGERAAVITDKGFYLCDASGTLSPLLVPDVGSVTWLGDSEYLALGRERRVNSWAAIVDAIGEEPAVAVAERAEGVWRRVEDGGLWSVIMMGSGNQKDALKIYLREHYAQGLQARVGDAWSDIVAATAQLSEVIPARIVGDRIETGTRLYAGFTDIIDLRPSPDGRALAITTEMPAEGSDNASIVLVAANGTGPVALVADNTAAYPDWTADGRSLVYVQSVSETATDDDLSLGALVQRRVIDDAGGISIAEKGDELAGLMFSVFARVRCLADGRILFNAAELCLPLAARDAEVERERLFALDAARQATLVRVVPRKTEVKLPEVLAFFEVSPDEKQVLFGGTEGEVSVLELANGEVEVLQESGDDLRNAPVWRRAGELTYYKRAGAEDGGSSNRKMEVILRRGEEETVLSQNWPDQVIEDMAE